MMNMTWNCALLAAICAAVMPSLADTPDAFVEYVESNGSQYVDTGIVGRCGTSADMTIQWMCLDLDASFLSSRTDGGNTRFILCSNSRKNKYYVCHRTWAESVNAGSSSYNTSAPDRVAGSITHDGTSVTFTLSVNGNTEVNVTRAEAALDTGLSMYLFAQNQGGAPVLSSSVRCYAVKIWQDGALVRDFRPCVKNDVAGLYDAVSESIFFPAEGTLVAGPPLKLHDRPDHFVQYVESTGTQYVDTEVVGRCNSEMDAHVMWVQTSDTSFLSSRVDGNNTRFILYGSNGSHYMAHRSYTRNTDSTVPAGIRCNLAAPDHVASSIVADGANVAYTMDVNGTRRISQTRAEEGIDTGLNMYLFAQNKGGEPALHSKVRCFDLKIWQDGALVRDFRPCVKDGRAGLYDEVSGWIFFARGGALAYPNERPDLYVDWANATGSSYVPLAVRGKSGIRAEMKYRPMDTSKTDQYFLAARQGNERFLLNYLYKTAENTIGYRGNYHPVSWPWTKDADYTLLSEISSEGAVSGTRNGEPKSGASALGAFDTGLNLYLFAINWSGDVRDYFTGRFYYTTMDVYDEAAGEYSRVRDLRPCVKGVNVMFFDETSQTMFKPYPAISMDGNVAPVTLDVSQVFLRRPWQQNVYTNRFTVMCETPQQWPGLELQYGENYEHSVACAYEFAPAGGTYVAKARVTLEDSAGATVKYRLAIPGWTLTGDAPSLSGEVRLWPMEDDSFTCSIWGDNQQGARAGDWDADKYLYVTRLFEHMTARRVDFGINTGDMASSANYATQIAPLILERNNGIFGWHTPYYIAWGNHDTSYPNNKPYFEASSIDDPDYGTSAVGNAYLYRGDTLFILLDDSVKGAAATKTWLENLLATERARNAKFRLVFHHVPIYTETSGSMATALEQTFIDGKVDVVFGGHMHGYERINRNGVVYLINGCAGYLDHPLSVVHNWGDDTAAGGHNPVPALWARQVASQPGTLAASEPIRMGMFVGYGELKVSGDTLTYLAHCFNADGSYVGVVDSFTLKSGDAPTASPSVPAVGAAPEGLIDGADFDLVEAAGVTSVHGTVGGPFRFAKSPVTRAQWAAWRQACGENVALAPEDAAKPATGMSKKEIGQFLAWINGENGKYRLPTAAEWAAAKFRRNGEWLGSTGPGEVSEWTSTVVPSTGRCRIMGGNSVAVPGTWTSLEEKPEVASDECCAVYLGFRLVESVGEWSEPVDPLDAVLDAAASIDPSADTGAYKWENGALVSIADEWFAATPGALAYDVPVVLTGRGAIAHTNENAVALRGGLIAPNAESFAKCGSGALEISGSVKVGRTVGSGVAALTGWLFTAEGTLTLDGVRYVGTSAQFRTADRELHLKGANDFSDATLVFNAESVTNVVCASDETASFVARNARQHYQNADAGYGIGRGVTFMVCDDLKLEQAAYSVDGVLRTAALNMTSNMGPWIWGEGEVRADYFGTYKNSWLRLGVSNVVITSARPCRSNYAESRHRIQVEGPAVRLSGTCDWTIPQRDTLGVSVEVGASCTRTDEPRLVVDTLDPDDGVTAHTFTFTPSATFDAWGITKVNPGTLVVSGTFGHSGETRVEGGVLQIRGATAFTAAPLRVNGGELAFEPAAQLMLSQGVAFAGGSIRLLPDEDGSYDYWLGGPRVVATAASVNRAPSVHSVRRMFGAKVAENPDGTFSVVIYPEHGLWLLIK